MATRSSASPAVKDVISRVYAIQAEYLSTTGWVPYVVGPGKVRWVHQDHGKELFTQEQAFTLQRQADYDIWAAP